MTIPFATVATFTGIFGYFFSFSVFVPIEFLLVLTQSLGVGSIAEGLIFG